MPPSVAEVLAWLPSSSSACFGVRQRVYISCLLIFSVMASGIQWDALQVFAWARMAVNYSREMPFQAAVARTFAGEMCNLCRLVADAKKQEQSRSGVPDAKAETKLLLFFQSPAPVFVATPLAPNWDRANETVLTELRSAPPLPPPRFARA